MKKLLTLNLIVLPFVLVGCGGEDVSSESSSSSSSAKGSILTEDTNHRYLRSDLIAFSDYDVISLRSENPNYSFKYKEGVISRGLFGNEDPHFISLSSKTSSLSIDPKSVDTTLTGLKEKDIRNLKFENHVQKAVISAEGVDASVLFKGKECSFDSYLNDGTLYFKPNKDAYSFVKWGMKLMLPKYGYDTSNYEFPQNGAKVSLSEEDISSINQSGFLPLSNELSLSLPMFLNILLQSEGTQKSTYELYGGKPRYTYDVKLMNLSKVFLDYLEELPNIDIEEMADYTKAIEEDLKPFLKTISSSDLDLRVTYNQTSIETFRIEGDVSFDEERMKEFILSREDVEAGDASVPLSFSIKESISFDFDQTKTITFPDFSQYEDFEMPPKKE